MQIAIPKALDPATLLQELEGARAEALALFPRPAYFVMDGQLENLICQYLAKTPQTLAVHLPASTREKQEAEREGILRPRLWIGGVPVLPSGMINLPDLGEVPEEERAEEEALYRNHWLVYVL